MSSGADKGSKGAAPPPAPGPRARRGHDAVDAHADRAEQSPRRHYDARASRQALLDAAVALFDERGYEAVTVREIGERAGVDAALIARYFGSKEGLYLAALQEREDRSSLPSDPARALEHMLGRAEDRGSGPIGLAMVSPMPTAAMREQVREILRRHVVEPIAGELAARGTPGAELRAELLVAMSVGVSLIRGGGTLPALDAAPLDEVLAVLRPLVDALQQV
jgi:AcrR family transcriptional regulator